MAQEPQRKTNTISRKQLHAQLMQNFNVEELKVLCNDLGADYDALPGDGKDAKVLAVVRHFERARHVPELLRNCAQLRPDLAWGSDLAPLDKAQPYLLAGSAVVGVLVLAFVAWLAFVPAKMDGRFRVVVAQFGMADATGEGQRSADGARLSEFVFTGLRTELESLPPDVRSLYAPVVWHESLGPLRQRANLGVVPGRTQAERRAAAEKMANEIGANLVIYGNLRAAQNPSEFVPEFFLADVKGDSDELAGHNQFGDPFRVSLPIDLADLTKLTALDRNARLRSEALANAVIALLYDLGGNHATAIDTLRRVEPRLAEWRDSEGKEVFYYLVGREALFLSRSEEEARKAFSANAPAKTPVDAALDEAERRFRAAKDAEGSYALARMGLGNTLFQRALRQSTIVSASLVSWADVLQLVDRALEELQGAGEANARAAAPKPTIALKVRISIGDGQRLKGVAHDRLGAVDAARLAFETAITTLDSAAREIAPEQARVLAQVRLMQGAASQERARFDILRLGDKSASRAMYEKAIGHYRDCVEIRGAEFDTTLEDIQNRLCTAYRALAQGEMERLAK